MTIKGPYVDGAWYNSSSETHFLCVSCANERELPESHAIMYDDMPDIEYIVCDDCGDVIRDNRE